MPAWSPQGRCRNRLILRCTNPTIQKILRPLSWGTLNHVIQRKLVIFVMISLVRCMAVRQDFISPTGDIAFDNLSIYKEYNQIVGKLGLPAYNVHGNHDMNLDVSHDSLAAETFKRHFGPADYSFNYGKVHFVVLDNVRYNGWDSDKNKNGGYTGYLNKRQLQWLKRRLKECTARLSCGDKYPYSHKITGIRWCQHQPYQSS